MKFTDYIALAKAGYKKAEIEKMLAEDAKEEKEQLPEPLDIGISQEPEPEKPTEPAPKAEEPAPDQTDYKALYEQAKKDLEAAQRANTTRDNSDGLDNKSGYEKLQDLYR